MSVTNLSADRPARGATIEGRYRYHLWRDFSDGKGRVCFIMLNPSTADGVHDDPTVRKCIYYARAWGFHHLDVVNLFPFRATDPKELLISEGLLGVGADDAIRSVSHASEMVVCAWGRLERKLAARAPKVLRMLASRSNGVMCLGLNADLSPKHPLYLRNELQPMRWITASPPSPDSNTPSPPENASGPDIPIVRPTSSPDPRTP